MPGEGEPHSVSLFLDRDRGAVTLRFDEAVAGAKEWEGYSVRVARRLKYYEVSFRTLGLPKETVELVWKFNASMDDGTLAGVILVRPNDLRVSGEKGFTLAKPV